MPFVERSPIVASVQPVILRSRHVATHPDVIEQVASWMAYEEFSMPGDMFAFPMGNDPDHLLDVLMLSATLDFAFSDFGSGVKFQVDYEGAHWSDSDAMFACLHRAITSGIPMTDGAWQAACTRDELAEIFRGNIEMPLLDERTAILNQTGAILAGRFGGRWATWAKTCEHALFADGNGMLERLTADFPRFTDVSRYDGQEIRIWKLAQLALWQLHATWSGHGIAGFPDLERMSAFADYIVPVGLRLMGMISYSPELEARINRGDLIPRDSDEEIEIRAHTIHATALLTDACNRHRPADMQLVIPQIDYRFWKPFHTTHWPHHLTRTVMY